MGAVLIRNNTQSLTLTAVYDWDHDVAATAYSNAALSAAITLPHSLGDNETIYLPNGLNFRLTISGKQERIVSQPTLQIVDIPAPGIPDLGDFVTQAELEDALEGVGGGSYEPPVTAGTSAQVYQGDKTWVAKTGLPISTATQAALDGKAASDHNHTGVYSPVSHNHDSAYAASGHNHNGTYATAAHNHDGTYATSAHNHSGVYATASHAHAQADITDLAAKVAELNAFMANFRLASGVSSYPRREARTGVSMSSGTLRLSYFTADRAFTAANITAYTTSTAAAATPTLCRMGLYSVAGNGDLTLVASHASDTALFNSTSGKFTKALTASYALTVGQLYAAAVLVVTGATVPLLLGNTITTGDVFSAAPRTSAAVNSQTDLPSSIAVGSLSNSSNDVYMELTP